MKLAESVTFGGGEVDRADHLRADPAALAHAAADPSARAAVFWRGKPLVRREGAAGLCLLPMGHAALADAGARVFLGLCNGAPRFAVDISRWMPEEDTRETRAFFDQSEQRHPLVETPAAFAELRGVMAGLDRAEAELAATGKAILGWQRSHRFCSACGQESEARLGGWQRVCPSCGAQHFPRTDPVVIMLITRGNSVLMGRSHGWPDGMYSLLAGFMEPGETIEVAVRREVFEETGIEVGEVGYLASQPWPYPSSLMIGCSGRATTGEIRLDPKELDDALWVSREEMLDAFAGRHAFLRPARKGSIAHFLLRNWLADRLE